MANRGGRSFRNVGTEDIFNAFDSKRARKACPSLLWKVARRKLEWMDSAAMLNDLRVPPANQLEALKGDRAGQHSIRINDQYRLCFVWTDGGPDQVEIVDYHSQAKGNLHGPYPDAPRAYPPR